MGYDNQKTGSSGTTTVIILLLVFVILGGVLVLGVGGWFFLSTSRTRSGSPHHVDLFRTRELPDGNR